MQRRLHAVPLVVAAVLVAPLLIAGPAQALPPGPGGIAPTPSTATGASVAAPTVTGPIANTSPLGDPAHGYPFLATDYDLAGNGYVEQEFFISGTATRYTIAGTATATVISSGTRTRRGSSFAARSRPRSSTAS